MAIIDCRMGSERGHPDFAHLRTVGAVPLADNPYLHTASFSVKAAFQRSFLISADSSDASIRSAGYEYIPIDVHIPVLDVPMVVDHRSSRILSDAVIQGTFYSDRRDYLQIFADLKESLSRRERRFSVCNPLTISGNATVWGYLPLAAEDASYIVDPTLVDPPFRLFLIGSGYLEIPHELDNIVLIRDGLNYSGAFQIL